MLEKLKDKYVFFDIDGTLSEYRYNDRLYASRDNEIGCQSLNDLLFNDLFYQARPLKTMQNIISKLDSDKIFVLGACVTNNEAIQKYKWLEENYPNFKKDHIIFVNLTLWFFCILLNILLFSLSNFRFIFTSNFLIILC